MEALKYANGPTNLPFKSPTVRRRSETSCLDCLALAAQLLQGHRYAFLCVEQTFVLLFNVASP